MPTPRRPRRPRVCECVTRRRRRNLDTDQPLHPLRRQLILLVPVTKLARFTLPPGVELALLRHGTRRYGACAHQPHALADERGHQMWNGLIPPVAIGATVAPPVELALLGQREGMTAACSNGDKPAPSLRQGFDPPGQHLGFQRAVPQHATLAVTERKDSAGIRHRQGAREAEGDAHHTILGEHFVPLRSQLGLRVKNVAQSVWPRFIVAISRPTPREEPADLIDRRACTVDPGCDALDLAQRLDPARHGPLTAVGVAERAVGSVAPRVHLALAAQRQAVPLTSCDAHDPSGLHRRHQRRQDDLKESIRVGSGAHSMYEFIVVAASEQTAFGIQKDAKTMSHRERSLPPQHVAKDAFQEGRYGTHDRAPLGREEPMRRPRAVTRRRSSVSTGPMGRSKGIGRGRGAGASRQSERHVAARRARSCVSRWERTTNRFSVGRSCGH